MDENVSRTIATGTVTDDTPWETAHEPTFETALSDEDTSRWAAPRAGSATQPGSRAGSEAPWADGHGSDPATDADAIESVAAINRHPLHPAIVPLPIGAFVGAFVADLAYARTHDRFWARSARHLTDAGIVTALLAASLGAVDFTGRPQIRRLPAAWVHAGGNAAVVGLAVVSRFLRRRDERVAGGGGLALSATMAGLLLVTGWLGGELSYRHRVGMMRSDG